MAENAAAIRIVAAFYFWVNERSIPPAPKYRRNLTVVTC